MIGKQLKYNFDCMDAETLWEVIKYTLGHTFRDIVKKMFWGAPWTTLRDTPWITPVDTIKGLLNENK